MYSSRFHFGLNRSDSFDNFKKLFSASAIAVEGSGWAILACNPVFEKLVVLQAEKHQDLTQWGAVRFVVHIMVQSYGLFIIKGFQRIIGIR